MSNIVLPLVISGKCYVVVGGVHLYFQKGLTISEDVESWNPASDWGKTGERHKSRALKISGTPVGMLTTGILDYFYAALLSPSTKIGKTIITGAAVVHDLDSNLSYSVNKSGLFTPPTLTCSPLETLFGAATWLGIGDISVQPTNAAFLETLGTATADTTYDESKIITDIYSAALGARSTPYSAMGSLNGFKFSPSHEVKMFPSADVGWADAKLTDVGLGVSFVPSNLTDAQLNTLRLIQDTGALLPGQQYAKAGEDLIVTGTQVGWIFNAKQVGLKKIDRDFMIDGHRHKEAQLVNRQKSTTGVVQPLMAYTAPS